MQIIKLDATDSTNSFLKELFLSGSGEDFTVVVAKRQRKGRGQMGTRWESEYGKNLTFSVLKTFSAFNIENQFSINMIVSLAIYRCLEQLRIPDITIKWPNDIMSGNLKLCGILPENIIAKDRLRASIIGIGLNINQTNFHNLPKATSLSNKTGEVYDVDTLLQLTLDELRHSFNAIKENSNDRLATEYEARLFRKDKASTFKTSKNEKCTGIIRGISKEGKIQIEMEDFITQEFGFKEIELLN